MGSIYALVLLVSLFSYMVNASVRKTGDVCVLTPEPGGRDDSPSILTAFELCKNDTRVIFENKTFHIEKVMITHGLHNVTVDVQGTLLWGTNLQYWINNSVPLGYQNQTVAWDFGGTDITWLGHGFGTFDGNGQLWYDLANGTSNMHGRPINLVVRGSENFRMSGMRFVQSQFWSLAVHSSRNLLFEDIYVNSTSSTSAPTQNTDGIDTFYTDNITLTRWDVTNGDDAVAPKANTSNLLIQDSIFRDGDSVAIGSIGQYPGVYEFIANVTAERIICERCEFAGYVKTWTGVEQGVPPNGGGGGIGFVTNIVFRDFVVSDLRSGLASITQCNSYIGATGECDTSTFQLSNISWVNMTGTVSTDVLAALQCSGAAPCTGIVIEGVDGVRTNGARNVTCSNIDLVGIDCTSGS